MKRLLNKCFLLCLSALLCICAPAAARAGTAETALEAGVSEQPPVDAPDGRFTKIVENDRLALYVHVATGNFSIFDKAGGQSWYACPPDIGTAGLLGSFVDAMQSLLNVTFSYESNTPMTVGSYDMDGDMSRKVYKIPNGIRLQFLYEREGVAFSVPMLITLHGDYIACEVEYQSITEGEGVQIMQIAPLPNFGIASADQEGYAFLPDGSGILINYSDARERSISYREPVYGADPSVGTGGSGLPEPLRLRMPVFGFARPGGAALAVIHQGDTEAFLTAEMKYGYLRCNANFVRRDSNSFDVGGVYGELQTMYMIQPAPVRNKPIIRYYFLRGKDADYSGMARAYRGYLEKEQGLTRLASAKAVPLTLEAFGGAVRKTQFLGIPVKSLVKATTFRQLEELQTQLSEAGLRESRWILYGFLSGGFENKELSSPRYESKLGGKKGYANALKALGKENVYTVYDVGRRYGASKSWRNAEKDVKNLMQLTVTGYYQKLSNGGILESFGLWTYRKASEAEILGARIIEGTPSGGGIVFAGMGEELYSNFADDGGAGRLELAQTHRSLLQRASGRSLRMAAEGGNVYLASGAELLYEIPLTGSGHTIESVSVPFYSMVLHGYVPLASGPVNNCSDAAEYALRALEQGVSLTCRVTGCNTYELRDTKLNFLYNSGFEKALAITRSAPMQDFSEIHETLAAIPVAGHHYEGKLSITTYENGWKIAVNYGDTEAGFGGRVIEPREYALIR